MNVYRGTDTDEFRFDHVSHLFHPVTVDDSFKHDGLGTVPSLRNQSNEWELKGHQSRIIEMDIDRLASFATTESDGGETPVPLLPSVYSREIGSVLEKLHAVETKLDSLGDKVDSFRLWTKLTP